MMHWEIMKSMNKDLGVLFFPKARCDICGDLFDEKKLKGCVECRARFCPICDSDDTDLCVNCFEDEVEEEEIIE